MTSEAFLLHLQDVRSRGSAQWSAKCPAHADRSPSLSICESGSRILLHCFGGCEVPNIVTAMGLTMADLFTDGPMHPEQRPRPRPPKTNLDDIGFKFELAALDRRLRAERVLQTISQLALDKLSEEERRRITHAQHLAEADNERAQLLEQVADDLRWKAFTARERNVCHAA